MLYPISENTNCTKVDDAHPSIVEIKNNQPDMALEKFSFSEIDEEFVGKRISKKATGIDGISPKLLHFAKPVITKPLKKIVNLAITSSIFGNSLEIN